MSGNISERMKHSQEEASRQNQKHLEELEKDKEDIMRYESLASSASLPDICLGCREIEEKRRNLIARNVECWTLVDKVLNKEKRELKKLQ